MNRQENWGPRDTFLVPFERKMLWEPVYLEGRSELLKLKAGYSLVEAGEKNISRQFASEQAKIPHLAGWPGTCSGHFLVAGQTGILANRWMWSGKKTLHKYH